MSGKIQQLDLIRFALFRWVGLNVPEREGPGQLVKTRRTCVSSKILKAAEGIEHLAFMIKLHFRNPLLRAESWRSWPHRRTWASTPRFVRCLTATMLHGQLKDVLSCEWAVSSLDGPTPCNCLLQNSQRR